MIFNDKSGKICFLSSCAYDFLPPIFIFPDPHGECYVMNYHSLARCLFLGRLFVALCASLVGAAAVAGETDWQDGSEIAQASASASPAAESTPVPQESPTLVPSEAAPALSESTEADALPVAVSGTTSTLPAAQPAVEVNGQEVNGQEAEGGRKVPTVIINGADYTLGNWHVRPTLSTTVTYDDNIFISNVNREGDLYLTISPGIALGWGDFRSELLNSDSREHWLELVPDDLERLNYFFTRYTASENLFLKHTGQDSLDEDAALDTQFQFSRLTLGLKTGVQTLSSPDIEIGGRIHRTVYNTELTSKYEIGEKGSVEVNFDEATTDYRAGALDSTEIANQDWFNYAVTPKIISSIGTRISYLDVQDNPGQTAEQFLLRTIYQAGAKLSINADLGVEFRQIESGGHNRTDGVFGIGANYQPFDGTGVTLTANRHTDSSASVAGEDVTVTGIDAEIHQRLFQKFYLVLGAGYSDSVYREILTLSTHREDNYVYLRPSTTLYLTRWASLRLSYQFQSNQSTTTFGFTDNMTMLQLDVVF